MLIRIAVCDPDSMYLDRLQNFFERNYSDKIEMVSFTNASLFRSYLENEIVDVILVSSQETGLEELGRYGNVAVLTENGEEAGNGFLTIEKYKKPALLYKDILNVYAESASLPSRRADGSEKSGNLILVTSFSGGTGVSTVSAAAARALAVSGEKTICVDYEPFGGSSVFFNGEGNYGFDNVLYSLKGNSSDLRLKLESSVRTDACGADFYYEASKAAYMLEVNGEEKRDLINQIRGMKKYKSIVLDWQMAAFEKFQDVLKMFADADRIILVNDGSMTANLKYERAMDTLRTLMSKEDFRSFVYKTVLLYNKFSSSKSSQNLNDPVVRVLGSIPPIKHATSKEIMRWISDNYGKLFLNMNLK